MADEFLTVEQAAILLQLNPQTVRRMLGAGKLPGRKLGTREWRLSRDALGQFIRGETKKPAKPKAAKTKPKSTAAKQKLAKPKKRARR